VGAPLWSSPLRIIDAAGLCEPAIVVTLKDGGRSVEWKIGSPAFYDWFFETAKPTFVALHDFWTVTTELDHDPRFLRDYAAIDAYWDRYAEKTFNVHSRSGMWVRRDALKTPDALDKLRARRSAPPTEPLAWRIQDRLFAPEWDESDVNRSILLLQRLLAQNPDDPALLQTLAAKLDGASRVDEARPLWARLEANAAASATQHGAARDRLHGAHDEADRARWMEEGVAALYDRHDTETAIDRFRRILAQDPMHYGASFQLARALDAAGRRLEAVVMWSQVLTMAERAGDKETAKLATAALGGTYPR
jgi:tetratricopeptide (TPR) repeat protein